MRTRAVLVFSLLCAARIAPGRPAAAQEFAAALLGARGAMLDAARGMGLGAFPAEVLPPVRDGREARRERARNKIAENGLRATVTVHAGDSALGSGFFVNTSGLVMTNTHVVREDPSHLTIETNDGRTFPARFLSAAPGRDIALIQVESDVKDWPALTFGNSEDLKEGHTVYALGNPVGLGLSFSQGVVSRPNQEQTSSWLNHIQSDIQISHGNSGGPLLNSRGEIVGMNSAIGGTNGRLAFSIRSEDLKSALSEFQRDGHLVDGIFPGSLLAVGARGSLFITQGGGGGLQTGDVVLAVDGTDLSGGASQMGVQRLMRAFGRKRPGETVDMRVRRSLQATLVVPGASESSPERTAAAFVLGPEGTVYVPPGSLDVLRAASAPPAAPKIRIDGADYAARVVNIGRTGYGILQVDADSGWIRDEPEEASLQVPVAPYAFDPGEGGS